MPKIGILSSVHQALDPRIFYREARSLRRSGYEVTVIAQHDRDEIVDEISIQALPRTPRWRRPLLWLTLLRRALASRADAFQFHDPELLLVVPWLRLLTGKPTIYDVLESHADFIRIKTYLPAWLRRPMARLFAIAEPWLARCHSGLIFADDRIAETFASLRCPKATLFNYPESDFVRQALEQTRGRGYAPVVLHLGGHEVSRGTALMVEAFERVARARPEARLLLVGPFFPPSLEQEMRADIARRGLTHAVTITGPVPFTQVGDYLRQASVGWWAAQPVAKYEKNIPTKIFEYMAYGCAVVSSDLQPVRPFIQPGRNGYLARPDDPAAHAQAILELLDHPEKARAMGQLGQEWVSARYNWDEMEKRLLAFYAQVLS